MHETKGDPLPTQIFLDRSNGLLQPERLYACIRVVPGSKFCWAFSCPEVLGYFPPPFHVNSERAHHSVTKHEYLSHQK
jgi:hypothetical protein